MFRRLKREMCFLIEHFRLAGLCAFLCCMGGILLWVSGGSNAYWLRGGPVPIGGLFFLWLLIYGLTGLLLACLLLGERRCAALGLCTGAYVLMLCWYAVYFCTRLVMFSGLLLLLCMICYGMIFAVVRRGFLLTKVIVLLGLICQICCLVCCYFVNLLI